MFKETFRYEDNLFKGWYKHIILNKIIKVLKKRNMCVVNNYIYIYDILY